MSDPQIIVGGIDGHHNQQSVERVENGNAYKDLSTVCVVPTRGTVPARAVETWMGLMAPMNQPFVRVFVSGMEVGAAYDEAFHMILEHPVLKDWKYVLTLEEDNLPPPDGLLRLYESVGDYAAVGGLYWTKGEEGQPMIYGRPGELPMFAPRPPEPDTVMECNGLGMGFTLFRLDAFRDMERPYFKTLQEWSPEEGARAYTQDLYAFERLRDAGHKVACDTRVKVGHLDPRTGIVW